MNLFKTKSIEQSLADTDEPEYQLKKSLTALDLTVFGVGVVIGAGIFTLTGKAAHNVAGPSIVLSFIVAAFCCALAAMCYAEFASTGPSRARPTRSRTPRWASCSPGSSAGT